MQYCIKQSQKSQWSLLPQLSQYQIKIPQNQILSNFNKNFAINTIEKFSYEYYFDLLNKSALKQINSTQSVLNSMQSWFCEDPFLSYEKANQNISLKISSSTPINNLLFFKIFIIIYRVPIKCVQQMY